MFSHRRIRLPNLGVVVSVSGSGFLKKDIKSICAGSAQISRSQSFEFNEDPAFWKDHNVQVIIRTRPLSNSEISVQGDNKCVRQDNGQAITWIGNPESRFTFDLVADENVTQEQMFKVAGVPMVDNVVAGYNSCMFAYGEIYNEQIQRAGEVEVSSARDVIQQLMLIDQEAKEGHGGRKGLSKQNTAETTNDFKGGFARRL